MPGLSTSAIRGLRVLTGSLAGVVALSGSVWALVLGHADLQFRRGDAASVSRALRAAPGDAGYLASWSLLAGTTEEAVQALQKTVLLDPFYSWAWIQLGLAAERDGNNAAAESDLIQAAKVDAGFAPRWALANFFFRRGNGDKTWYWGRQALTAGGGESAPLFRLYWRIQPDAKTILDRGIPPDKTPRREFLEFLTEQQPSTSVSTTISALIPDAEPGDLPRLLAYVRALLADHNAESAEHLWNSLCDHKLLPFRPVHPDSANLLTNADFATPPSGEPFDWQFHPANGIEAANAPSGGAFQVRLSGRQPENWRILTQTVAVDKGRRYEFRSGASGIGQSSASGLRWRILGEPTGRLLAESQDLATDNPSGVALSFTPDSESLITIALDYERPRGVTRYAGVAAISQLSLHRVAVSGVR